MENMKEWNEKEQNQRKREEEDSGLSTSSISSQAGSMFKNAQSSLPKMPSATMPNFGGFKL
jgi:hypothetical protein